MNKIKIWTKIIKQINKWNQWGDGYKSLGLFDSNGWFLYKRDGQKARWEIENIYLRINPYLEWELSKWGGDNCKIERKQWRQRFGVRTECGVEDGSG